MHGNKDHFLQTLSTQDQGYPSPLNRETFIQEHLFKFDCKWATFESPSDLEDTPPNLSEPESQMKRDQASHELQNP